MSKTRELPLFPLNTVLFPGMPLYLHIFEPRYKLMINECIQQNQPFGVVLIRAGSEVGDHSPETHAVGTTAYITKVQRMERGELNIATLGSERFRIEQTHLNRPYLTGVVSDFPFTNADAPNTRRLALRLAPRLKKYLNFFAALGEVDFRIDHMPEDPATLAFLAAVALNIPPADKQTLLTCPDLLSMLEMEQRIILREAVLLRHILKEGEHWRNDPHSFSPN